MAEGNLCRSDSLTYLRRGGRADERTRTAYPCSLRVIHRALQRCAEACKYRMSKRLSLLRVAACCTVLRLGGISMVSTSPFTRAAPEHPQRRGLGDLQRSASAKPSSASASVT